MNSTQVYKKEPTVIIFKLRSPEPTPTLCTSKQVGLNLKMSDSGLSSDYVGLLQGLYVLLSCRNASLWHLLTAHFSNRNISGRVDVAITGGQTYPAIFVTVLKIVI